MTMNVYDSIIEGLNEAVEYEKENVKAKTSVISVAPLPEIASGEIKNIRKSLDMTQVMFAAVMGASVKTVEAWEAGTNTPSGTARRMLFLLRSDPNIPEKYHVISR